MTQRQTINIPFFRKIQTRIIVAILSFGLIPFSFVQFYSFWQIEKEYTQAIIASVEGSGHHLLDIFNGTLLHLESRLKKSSETIYAQTITHRKSESIIDLTSSISGFLINDLQKKREDYEFVKDIYGVSVGKKSKSHANAHLLFSLNDPKKYMFPNFWIKKNNDFILSPEYQWNLTNDNTDTASLHNIGLSVVDSTTNELFLAYPYKNNHGESLAFVALIDLEKFLNVLINSTVTFEGKKLGIAVQNDYVHLALLPPKTSKDTSALFHISTTKKHMLTKDDLIKLLNKISMNTVKQTKIHNIHKHSFFSGVSTDQNGLWRILLLADSAVALKTFHNIRNLNVTIGIMSALFIVFGGFWFSKQISDGFKRIITGIRHAASGNLDHRIKSTSKDEIGLISAAFNNMLRTIKASIYKQQRLVSLEKDVEIIGTTQSWFLPKKSTIKTPHCEISGLYQPAEQCSGDSWWYHIDEESNSLFVFAADVTGHGLAPAFITSVITTTARNWYHTKTTQTVPENLALLNKNIYHLTKGEYMATMTALFFDWNTHTMTVYNAGGSPVAIVNKDHDIKVLSPHGNLLGHKDLKLGIVDYNLCKDDRVLIMTDGIVEATCTNGRAYGIKRSFQTIQKLSDRSTEKSLKIFLEDISKQTNNEQDDDFTAVLIQTI